MRGLLRRLRGAVGIGGTWAAAWAAIFAAMSLIIGLVDPDSIDSGEGPIGVAGIGAVFGFVSGSGFSLLVYLAERRKAIRELSLCRAAVWGILGTSVFPLMTAVHDSMLVIVCPIGAALATASVALAQRTCPSTTNRS